MYSPYVKFSKKDETLTKYLMRKYHGDFCYLKIANWVVEKTKVRNKIDDEEDLIDCIMSYLYWAYGDPFDEYNILKVMIDIITLRKKNKKKKSPYR